MHGLHHYEVSVEWTGNLGDGTAHYTGYRRDHLIAAPQKSTIEGSADPAFRGDASRWNPEELLVASVSACHKLWYLHLCAGRGISVLSYRDDAIGDMLEDPDMGGRFTQITLRPVVTIRRGDDMDAARKIHRLAHEKCFIANSLNFPVTCDATVEQEESKRSA